MISTKEGHLRPCLPRAESWVCPLLFIFFIFLFFHLPLRWRCGGGVRVED